MDGRAWTPDRPTPAKPVGACADAISFYGVMAPAPRGVEPCLVSCIPRISERRRYRHRGLLAPVQRARDERLRFSKLPKRPLVSRHRRLVRQVSGEDNGAVIRPLEHRPRSGRPPSQHPCGHLLRQATLTGRAPASSRAEAPRQYGAECHHSGTRNWRNRASDRR